MSDYFIAEFKGTYRAPHADGIRDQFVLKNFHVKVKMKRDFLAAPGLNGTFANYYAKAVAALYPDFVDLYQFEFVEGLELDGKKIDNPKAMSHADLVEYVTRKKYPINTMLFNASELRNEVVLYEQDPSGQQTLQARYEKQRGGTIALSNELSALDDLVVRVDAEPVAEAVLAGKPPAKKG